MKIEVVQNKIINIENYLKGIFIERDEHIEALFRAMLSDQNILFLGPPGTAKSLIVNAVSRCISGTTQFSTLLTKFSTPEDVFGPVSIKALKEDLNERLVDGYLPTAHFAFVDEVFKANPGILNSLLSVMNERVYYNGRKPLDIPLFVLVGASNEVPEEDDGLMALYDRFHIKLKTQPIQESAGFMQMLVNDFEFAPNELLTLEEIYAAQEACTRVEMPVEFIELISELRANFKNDGIYVTDRQWRQTISAIKSCAFVRGDNVVQEVDLEFLARMLWNNPDQERHVAGLVYDKVNPDKKEAMNMYDQARDILEQLGKIKDAKQAAGDGIAGAHKLKSIRKNLRDLIEKRKKYGKDFKEIERIDSAVSQILTKVSADYLGIDFAALAGK